MKLLQRFTCICLLACLVFIPNAEAQIWKKIKKKGKEMIDNSVKKEETKTTIGTPGNPSNTDNNSSVQGKKLTPPDVNQHINGAETAWQSNQYSNARYEIKQALLGIEIELGYKILDAMPKSVDGINFKEEQDQVVSTGIGFVGLAVGREYPSDNKTIEAGVYNNSGMLASYNVILTSPNYTSNDGSSKSIMVQGNRAVIRFDGDNGYEIGVPLGQSSVFILKADGYGDENQVTALTNSFDLAKIKSYLGEQ